MIGTGGEDRTARGAFWGVGGPAQHPGATLLWQTNSLLTAVGVPSSQKIKTLGELQRVASSLFVTVYESLFQTRLDGVCRKPRSRDELVSNVQCVIDALGRSITVDLSHISAREIVSGGKARGAAGSGDYRAFNSLLQIFIRICAITGQDSVTTGNSADEDVVEGNIGGGGGGGGGGVGLEDSISTRQSTFRGEATRGTSQSSGAARRFGSLGSTRGSMMSEQWMLRNVMTGLLRSMHGWHRSEALDARERVRVIKSENKSAVQSMSSAYEDRLDVLREHVRSTSMSAEVHDRAQVRVREQLRFAYSDRQRRMRETQKAIVVENRLSDYQRRLNASKHFHAFLQAER